MYQMIRKGGIGERAEPIFWRRQQRTSIFNLPDEYEPRPCRELARTLPEQ